MRDPVMRLRCPKDTPAEAARHVAMDVRLPLHLDAMATFLTSNKQLKCACGAAFVVRAVPDEEVSNG